MLVFPVFILLSHNLIHERTFMAQQGHSRVLGVCVFKQEEAAVYKVSVVHVYAYRLIPQPQPHTAAGNRENLQNPQCPETGEDSFNKVLEACSKPGVVTGKA